MTVSGSYRSQFPFCRDNKVHALRKGAPSFLVYSNYPVCPPINTPDQSSLGKLKVEKTRNQRAEKDRKRCGGGGEGGGAAGSDKASREKKSMWEGRDKWRCEIWRKTWQGEESELREGMKETERMTKTLNTLRIKCVLNGICWKMDESLVTFFFPLKATRPSPVARLKKLPVNVFSERQTCSNL